MFKFAEVYEQSQPTGTLHLSRGTANKTIVSHPARSGVGRRVDYFTTKQVTAVFQYLSLKAIKSKIRSVEKFPKVKL